MKKKEDALFNNINMEDIDLDVIEDLDLLVKFLEIIDSGKPIKMRWVTEKEI